MPTPSHLVALAVLVACEPEPSQAVPEPALVEASVAWSLDLPEVHYPSDLLALEEGGWVVLDGYRGRGLVYGPDHDLVRTVGTSATWGRPVRMTRSPEGWWLVLPEAGVLREVDRDGTVLRDLQVGAPGESVSPITALDTPAGLAVGDRDGRLWWHDPVSGTLEHQTTEDVDGMDLGAIVDLASDPSGTTWAVDALASRVHQLDEDGRCVGSLGHPGVWTGSLAKAKSVATGPLSTLLVADSALGSVQIFEQDGAYLGLLSDGDAPLTWEHPIAVRKLAPSTWGVVDAAAGTLTAVSIPDTSIQDARNDERRHLRSRLLPEPDPAAQGDQLCVHCHDGLINDSREVWDTTLQHHTLGQAPTVPVPEDFSTAPDGGMVCVTCHAPHGEAAQGTDPQPFLRRSTHFSELCVTCHPGSPHADAPLGAGATPGGHPAGDTLVQAMEHRSDPDDPQEASASCLGCHDVHGASADHLASGAWSGEACARCHPTRRSEADNHPLTVPPFDPAASPHGLPLAPDGAVACLTCHDLATPGESLLRTADTTLCTSCHTSTLGGAHTTLSRDQCGGCHDVHQASGLMAPGGGACEGCHDDLHPGPHADGGPTCKRCHEDPHDPGRPTSEVCTVCHRAEHKANLRGGHGDQACADCHPPHHEAPTGAANRAPDAERCMACHGDQGLDITAMRPHLPMRSGWRPVPGLPLFGADGSPQGTHLGCTSCHTTHGPPAGGEDELLRPGWERVCGSCHGREASSHYLNFHDREAR